MPGAPVHIARSQYDYSTGQLTGFRDRNNTVTQTNYNDPFNRPTLVKAALGVSGVETLTSTYYAPTTVFGITLARNDTLTTTDLNTVDDASIRSWTVTDGFGRNTESWTGDPQGDVKVISVYDSLGRTRQVSNPFRPSTESAVYTTTVYDLMGRITSVTTPDNATVNTSYAGNTIMVTDQAGKSRKSVTDGLERLVEVYEDPNGLNYLTTYTYDMLDNLVKVTQGSQQRFFMYDSLKQLIRSRNPEQGTLADLNLSDSITGNSAWSTGYQYDSNGNLTQKTDARGVASIYVYDALNRNTTIDHSDTSSLIPDVTRVYDGAVKGKGLLWKSYAGGTESNGSNVEKTVIDSYDALRRPLVLNQSFKLNNEWKPPYQTTRAYNLAGAVTSQIYPSEHFVTYNYDNAGRLADKDASNLAFTGNLGDGAVRTYSGGITYASGGQLAQEQFGTTAAPVYNKRFYNSRQQLAEILVSTTIGDTWDRGKILNEYSLQCSGANSGANCNATDNNGNLRKQEVFIPNISPPPSHTSWYQQYDYDELNRLKRVHEYTGNTALDWQQEFDYDRWGNRTINATSTWIGNQSNPPNPLLNERQFDTSVLASTNRLQASGDQALPENQRQMRYDNAGNLIKDIYTGVGDRMYDAENRMTQAWGGNNQWQYYTYNADGQRTRRKINNQETWLVYGFDGELLAEYSANGATNSPTKEYGYRNGQLLITAESGVTRMNVALSANGATASASSQITGNYPASSTINGDRRGLNWNNGGGWNDATVNIHPDWLQIDFNGSKTIDEINVITLQDNPASPAEPTESMTFTLYGLTGYSVEYWNGSAWTTVTGGIVSGNNKVWRKFTFAPITTSKIRVFTSSSPDAYSRITEVEAWGVGTPPPRTNFALGGTTSASSQYSANYPAVSTINGDRRGLNWNNGGGWNDATVNIHPDWLQIDFNGSKTIDEINVFTLQDNPATPAEPTESMTFTLYGLTGYSVEYWNGSAWTTVPGSIVSGNNKVWRKFTFAPITTTKIRVFTSSSPDAYSRITEVEAWGPTSVGASGGIKWLVPDHLGTPRIILDQTGSLAGVTRHDYFPFGEELFAGTGSRTGAMGYSSDGVRQQFTSKERDIETNLDWFGPGRFYSNSLGRFTSVDPLRESASPADPQSWNRYSYVLNRATVAIDPNGLSTIVITVNPRSDGGNGHATLHVFDRNGNGVVVRNDSNRVDARAMGQGPNRATVNNDTPFGVYSILPNHNGSDANGTDGGTAGVAARPQQTEFGTGIITMQPVSGEVRNNNRSAIYIHGGGRDQDGGLTQTLNNEQPLTPTFGCVRVHNVDVNALITTVNNLARNRDAITNIFIGDTPTLNAQADERDTNGNYRYPELRRAGFGSPDAQGRPAGHINP